MTVVAILVTSRLVCVIFSPKKVILKSFALLLGCTVHVGGLSKKNYIFVCLFRLLWTWEVRRQSSCYWILWNWILVFMLEFRLVNLFLSWIVSHYMYNTVRTNFFWWLEQLTILPAWCNCACTCCMEYMLNIIVWSLNIELVRARQQFPLPTIIYKLCALWTTSHRVISGFLIVNHIFLVGCPCIWADEGV